MAEKESSKIISTTHPKPQDGGTAAWLQVLGSAFVMFNIW
jgi:hypothetical protein